MNHNQMNFITQLDKWLFLMYSSICRSLDMPPKRRKPSQSAEAEAEDAESTSAPMAKRKKKSPHCDTVCSHLQ